MTSKSLGSLRFVAFAAVIAAGACAGILNPTDPSAVSFRKSDYEKVYNLRPSSRDNKSVSWVDSSAKHSDLLYVSDEGSNAVYIYAWPSGHKVGGLVNISYPQGECVDAAGNVYITSVAPPYGSYIVKYPHGSATPSSLVEDPGYIANGCAVDPTTGHIAVTNLETFKFGYGDLKLYTRTGKSVGEYGNANLLYYFFCSYDAKGNLYVDGAGDYNPFDVFNAAEMSAGSSQLTIIKLNQTIDFPGAVQAHDGTVAIGDADKNVVYEFKVRRTEGTKVRTTHLRGGNHVLQFWIDSKRVTGASAGAQEVFYWPFPDGGVRHRIGSGFTDPVGVAISLYHHSPLTKKL